MSSSLPPPAAPLAKVRVYDAKELVLTDEADIDFSLLARDPRLPDCDFVLVPRGSTDTCRRGPIPAGDYDVLRLRPVDSQAAVAAVAPPAAAAATPPPAAASSHVVVRHWDSEALRSVQLSPSGGVASLEPAVCAAFAKLADASDPAKECRLYFLDDPSRPRQTKVWVHNEATWREFWARHTADPCLLLHLHFTPRAEPGTPGREPSWLKINTADLAPRTRILKASASAAAAAAAAATASPSASPSEVQTPRSPVVRAHTLIRDFDAEKDRSYCVFCGDCGPSQMLVAAHVIPHAVAERYQLDVSDEQFLSIGFNYESALNIVSACTSCHSLFDAGLFWLIDAAAGSSSSSSSSSPSAASLSSLVICVDSSVAQDPHPKKLAGRQLRLPSSELKRKMFPPVQVWLWRVNWAPLKRADQLANALGRLGVSGPCDNPRGCGAARNMKCRRRMCKSCCQCIMHAGQHDHEPCSVHKPDSSPSASSPLSAPA